MALKALKTIQPKEYELDVVQRNVKEYTGQLNSNPLLSGVHLKGIVLSSSSSNTITHKLGRGYIGWFITKIKVDANIYENTTQTLPTRNIVLETTADATVDIYIF
jgi:hypothetical protein